MVNWANLIGLGLGLGLVLFVANTVCVNHSVEEVGKQLPSGDKTAGFIFFFFFFVPRGVQVSPGGPKLL